MPVNITAAHSLTATTPDDPAYEIRPSHWNNNHLITASLNVSATEISGLFSNANGVSFGMSGNSITASIAAGGAPGSVIVGADTLALGQVVFTNGSGVSFGLNGSTLNGSVATSYRASNDAIGLNSALTANGVSMTANSSGLSLNFPAFLTTAALSNHSHGDPTLALTRLSGTTASNSNGFTLSLAAQDTAGALTSQSNQNALAANGNFNFQTLSFSNANGVSFATSAGSAIVASVETTYAASNHSHGNPTLALTNINGTTASASNGLTLSLSAIVPAQTNQSLGIYASSNTTMTSSGTIDARSLTFRGMGVASVGYSAGEVLISVPAGGGAGDGYNIVSMLTSTSGGGTAGATFSALSGSIGLMAGSNITLSQTSNTINIVAPNSSSLVAASGVTLSTAGSTISVGLVANSIHRNAGQITAAGTAQGNSLVSVVPFMMERGLSFSNALVAASFNVGSAANNSSAYLDVSFSGVVYSRNVSTLSSITSFSNSMTQTWSSNATGTVTGVIGITATLPGVHLTFGEYWLAVHISTNNTATGGAATTALGNTVSMILANSIGSAANQVKVWGGQTNASLALLGGQGIISTGATRASIGLSDIVVTGTRGHLAPVFFELRNGTYQI